MSTAVGETLHIHEPPPRGQIPIREIMARRVEAAPTTRRPDASPLADAVTTPTSTLETPLDIAVERFTIPKRASLPVEERVLQATSIPVKALPVAVASSTTRTQTPA